MSGKRQRGLPVKPSGLELIERRMREKGCNYSSQTEMYSQLATITRLSTDTIKNIFNPDWGKNPERNTVQAIAQALEVDPSDLVEKWIKNSFKPEFKAETTHEQVLSLQIFTEMLAEQIKRMTTNPLTAGDGIALERERMYVPLGLMERRKRPKVKETEAEKGSRLYTSEEEITRRFENDEFFCEVIEGGDSPKSQGRRIVIIGEPGAGKTTLLQQIVDRVSKTHPEDFIIWVSLADLKGEDLESYLLDRWLKVALRDFEAKTESKQALVDIFKTRKVWLLLDGLDEMGINNPLLWIRNQIGQGWLSEARIVLTCRLNVWDNGKNYLEDFDIYRNLDFDEEQVIEFIDKFFEDKIDRAASLREELNKSGKERIRDLIKNPLRLTLLCYAWQRREGALPETKAGLYEWFVETLYEWKSEHFPTTSSQREELSRALGELAKEAIDRPGDRFRLSRKQVVKHLGQIDRPLCELALNIGWLNIVGVAEENPDKEVYAFFHASFQEYFAALAIDDNQFFLNHFPVNPDRGIYRVFEPQWEEVILLWLGVYTETTLSRNYREILLDEILDLGKEESMFIETKCILFASQALSDFKGYKHEDELVKRLIGWISEDCFNLLSNHAENILSQSLARNKVYQDYQKRQKSNKISLKKFFLINNDKDGEKTNSTLQSKKIKHNRRTRLGATFPEWYLLFGNSINLKNDNQIIKIQEIYYELKSIEFSINENLDHYFLIDLIAIDLFSLEIIFEKIDSQQSIVLVNKLRCFFEFLINENINKGAIEKIESKISDRATYILSNSLINFADKRKIEKIAKNIDEVKKPKSLINFMYLLNKNIPHYKQYESDNCVINAKILFKSILKKIKNIDIFDKHFQMILEDIIDVCFKLASLDKLLFSEIVINFKKYLLSNDNDFNELRFFFSRDLIWHCAQHMTYPEFYKAWHDRTENPIPESLQQQDLTIILETLKTNNPDLRTINIKSLNRETDLDRLAKDFSNRVFLNHNVSIAHIYDLENHIQTQTPNLTLILHGGEPSDSLLQFCEHLGEFARIAIITDRSIEPPLRGFPPAQANLENTLQEWLER